MKSYLLKFAKYLKYIRPYLKYEIMIFILISLSSILALANPILLRVIIDRVLILKEFYLLKYIIAILFAFYIFNTLIIYSNGFLNSYIGQSISIKIRKDLLKHIQRIKMDKVTDVNTGDLVSKITDDVSTITGFLNTTIISVVSNILNIFTTFGLMLFFSWKLSLIAIVITILQLFASMKFVKITRENQKQIRELSSEHISFLKQVFTGIKFIKAYKKEKNNEKNYNKILSNFLKLNFKGFSIYYGYSTTLSFISFAGSMLIFSYGVYEIYRGNLTVGALFVFDSVSERFYQFAKSIVDINVNIQSVVVATDRLNSILDLDGEDYSIKNSKFKDNSIEFENVCFKYDELAENDVLKDVNLKLLPGETYALIGASGQGKSTILNLILNFYEPSSGTVYIGRENIKNIDLRYLREKITIVFQDAELIFGDIEDNIRFGNKHITFEEIQRISELCYIDEFVDQLPQGYRTKIGEEGEKLSGGQKQRLLIARGMLRNSEIYIFDEVLSNLDKNLEDKIFNNTQEELKGKTQIYITHNISLIKNLKNIIVVNNGRIEAVGNHSYLLKNSETYKDFHSKGENNGEKSQYVETF